MAVQVEDEVWDLGEEVTPALLRHIGAKDNCVVCSMTRRQHKPREGTGTMRWKVGEQFSFDYQGKYTPKSQGKSGYNLITDGGCKALMVYGQTEKIETEDTIQDYVAYSYACGHRPRWAQCDAGSIEASNRFKEVVARLGIQIVQTAPGEPAKDIERSAQFIHADIAAVLTSKPTLRATDWWPAVKCAVEMRSATSNERSRDIDPRKSPREIFEGRKIKMKRLKDVGIGDIVTCARPTNKRHMARSRNEAGIHLEPQMNQHETAMVELFGRGEQPRRRGNIQRVDIGTTEEEEAIATVDEDEDGGYTVRKPMTRSQVRSVQDIQQMQAARIEMAATKERSRELGMEPEQVAERRMSKQGGQTTARGKPES